MIPKDLSTRVATIWPPPICGNTVIRLSCTPIVFTEHVVTISSNSSTPGKWLTQRWLKK